MGTHFNNTDHLIGPTTVGNGTRPIQSKIRLRIIIGQYMGFNWTLNKRIKPERSRARATESLKKEKTKITKQSPNTKTTESNGHRSQRIDNRKS